MVMRENKSLPPPLDGDEGLKTALTLMVLMINGGGKVAPLLLPL